MSKSAPMKGKGHHNKVQTATNTKNDGKKKDDDSSFVYNLGILIGCVAEIETRGGEKFEGVLSAFTNQALKIMIEAAHEPNGEDESSITKHYDLLIVPADKVSVIKFRNAELTYATRDFQTDAVIGATRQVNVRDKELTPWEGADEVGETLELDSTNTQQNGWEAEEMFKENEEKYGVISSFSKDLSGYTTQLDKTDADSFKKHEEAAAQIAQEIEGNSASWERTTVENGDDEEDKFSAVRRPSRNNSNNSNNNPPPSSNTSSSSGTGKYVCPSRRPTQENIQGQGHSVNNNGPPSINNNNGNGRKPPYDGPRNNFGPGSTHSYHPRNFDNPQGRGRGHPQYPNARDRREDGNRPHRMGNKPPMDRDRNRGTREEVNKLKQFGENFRLHDSVPNRTRMPQNQAQHSGPPVNAHINTSAATGNNVPASSTSNIRNPSPPNNNSALQISSTQSPAKPNNKKEEFSPVPPLIQSSGPASTNSEISSGSGTDSPHSSSNPTNANSASPSPNMSSSSSMNQTTNETTPTTPGSTESQSSAIVSSDSKGSTEAENKLKKTSFVFNPNAKEFVFNPAAKPYTPQRSPSTPPRPPSTPASTPQIIPAQLHSYMPLPMPHQPALLYAPPPTSYTNHAQAALTPSSNSSASSGGNTPRHSHRSKGIISGPPRSDLSQPMQMATGPPILAAPASIQTAAPQQFAYVQNQNGTFQPVMRVNPNMIPMYQTEGSGGTHMHQSMYHIQHNGGTPQSNAGHQQATTPQSNPNAPTSNVSANGHAYGQGGANHGPPHMGFPFITVPMVGVSYPPHGQHPATHVLTPVPTYVTQGGGNAGIPHSQYFVLSNGVLSYYRNQAEVNHTCRGSISLHGALIYTEDTCNLVVSNGGTQTFHLRASSEVERQRWVTALELAKAKAIRTMESEEEEELEEVTAPPDNQEVQNVFRMLSAKLEDMQTCCELINKHGNALQKALSELESTDNHHDIVSKVKQVNERATLFRITSTAMINACTEYAKTAQSQGKKWQKAIQYEKEQRQRLERVVEDLAKQHTKLEEAAAVASHHGQSNVQSDEDDETVYYDAVETSEGGATEFTVDVPISVHRRTSSGISTDSQRSEGKQSNSSSEGEEEGSNPGASQQVRCIRAKKSDRQQQLSVSSKEKEDGALSSNSELVPVASQRVRRKRVPDKPNYPLNLWSIMKNCIGKELTKIPMPVNFSEPLSMLQRLTEDFEYSQILDRAAKSKDSCEQLSYVAAFTVSSYATTAVRTGKPFNPLLGETFECDRMDDLGWRCLNEQVSHHPPMAAQYCEGRGWKCWQEFTMSSKFRGKYLQVIPLGIAHLVFTDSGNHFTWRKVTTTIHNIIVGKLWVDQHGEMDIMNHQTGDKCHLKYIPYSYFNRDVQRKVTGCVMDKHEKVRWILNGTWDAKMETCEVLNQKDTDKSGKPVLELGSSKTLWERKLPPPDSERYYNFTELACQLNEKPLPDEIVAPTDSRLRPDQRLMEDGLWDEANTEKLRLEEKQRTARRSKETEAEKAAADGRPVPSYEPIWFNKDKDPLTGNVIHVFKGDYWTCKEKQEWSKCPDIF
ncbi:unnamed protein product [Allacma fusca]|uniref:Oxysterol-binding protein n=1 Tax=Allacma fusca TaxID=39272 RepID=A0A8J2J4F7_9HEXA|nr:unnamed protein product [Allacma fusca]